MSGFGNFGSSPPPPPPFGSTNPSQQQQQPPLFGSSGIGNNNSGGGLFGTTTTSGPAFGTTGGFFGTSTTGGGGFGTSTSLFGSPTAASGGGGIQTSTSSNPTGFGNSGGSFGAPTTTPAASSGLFFGGAPSSTSATTTSAGFGGIGGFGGGGGGGSIPAGTTSSFTGFGTLPNAPSTFAPSFGTTSATQQSSTFSSSSAFGQQQQQPSSSLFGPSTLTSTGSNPFGTPAGFATNNNTNTVFGGDNRTSNPFGAGNGTTNSTGGTFPGFGSSTPAGFFGASSSTTNQPPTTGSTLFGPSSTTFSSPFGSSSQQTTTTTTTAASSPFGASPTIATSTSIPFGASPFVQHQQQPPQPPPSSAFGASSSIIGTNPPPFGTSPFSSNPPPSTTTNNNTFGFPSQQSTPPVLAFGSSTNVANPFGGGSNTNIATPGFGFNSNSSHHQTTTASSSSSLLFGGQPYHSDLDMRTSPVPTGISPQSMSPMRGGQSDSEDMGDGEDVTTTAPSAIASNLPFGKHVAAGTSNVTTTTNTWGSSSGTNNPFASIPTTSSGTYQRPNLSSLSPIPETMTSVENVTPTTAGSSTDPAAIQASNEDKLNKLKAKLEQKKKKLEEKRRKEEVAASSSSPSPIPPPQSSQGISSSIRQAEKNAIRFAKNLATSSTSDLPAPSDNVATTTTVQSNREELENAVSLVGTCLNMCPEEEVQRRERESDIQLLEKPMPGKIHPVGWTIRDTMVKRFRRSAADYKLDVPEWIRPPDVLERVCGYLEEWVMERDRQGPDQRFIESGFNLSPDGTPPSLDVYQFIWDRTRMVRKDFILQNYVGTGGNCDARAVRCHERIARWHAMCEHQLSHIPEFVKQQSQQNIQELGQTMKTLNQYYDDTLNRSLVEVPDEHGKETRTNLAAFNHGCNSNSVQGPDPIDFDKSPLMNDDNSDVAKRRIIGGKEAVDSAHHGTAEPELRGLYILLTLENDGGMEVLKYAARLYQIRPDVYHSTPVQLALNVYKARKEYNYVRFFSILRSPSTPYLFGCIMYKYVETMRKYAFRIMSKTYGGRSRENEAIYDAYPLLNLTNLLCFEDDDEARAACQHYNITVKDENGTETIFWRQSPFKEPKDPDKGIAIRLIPKKMMKTIEVKAQGLTRLAVCRGEVSGEGSFLSNPQTTYGLLETAEDKAKREEALKEARRVARENEDIRLQKEKEALAARRKEEDAKRKELERLRLAELERKQLEEEKRKRELIILQKRAQEERERLERELLEKEKERKKREQELEATRRKEEEAERLRQMEIRRLEELQRKAEEVARQERLREEERQREAEAMRRREQEEAMRRLAEQERRQKEAEAEHRRKENERIQIAEQRRIKQEQERREAEVLRLHNEAQARTNTAKKKLIILRWMHKLPRHFYMKDHMIESLGRISPLGQYPFGFERQSPRNLQSRKQHEPSPVELRRVIERLLKFEKKLLQYMSDCIVKERKANRDFRRDPSNKITFLYKICVVLPIGSSAKEESFCDLIRAWINSRFCFRSVNQTNDGNVEIRLVIVDGRDKEAHPECDAVIFIIPPPWSENPKDPRLLSELESMARTVDDEIPRLIFVLTQNFHPNDSKMRKESIVPILTGSFEEVFYIENDNLDQKKVDECLAALCELVARLLSENDEKFIDQISLDLIWMKLLQAVVDDVKPEKILVSCQQVVCLFVEELSKAVSEIKCSWPATEFATGIDGMKIRNYFGPNSDLPLNWISIVSETYVEPLLLEMLSTLDGTFTDVVWGIIKHSPFQLQQTCHFLLEEKQYLKCLWSALNWKIENENHSGEGRFVFAPPGFIHEVFERTKAKWSERHPALTTEAGEQLTHKQVGEDELSAAFNSQFETVSSILDPSLLSDIDSSGQRIIVENFVSDVESMEQQEASEVNVSFSANTRPILQSRNTKRGPSQAGSVYTKRLKRYLSGEETKNMIVGNTTLLAALRDVPPLKDIG